MTVREYREANGLTQAQFCERVKGICDLTVPLVSAIESGKVDITDELKVFLALPTGDEDVELSPVESIVLEACKRASADNPITRSELKDYTSTTDRKSRAVIESLRKKGFPIVSNLHGVNGYWYGSPEEYREWARQYVSYAYSILKTKSAMDRRVEGQVSWQTEKKTGASSKCIGQ